ncbi:MAG TPA: HTH domain-containing protein [Phycisphaerales bacterium]|nr:HTH domain-containing protein [Phycisphaerales bacterium]
MSKTKTSKPAKKTAAKKAVRPAPKPAKPTKGKGVAAKVTPPANPGKRVSSLDAAAQVLAGSTEAMKPKALIAAMTEQKLWTSPAGKTPHVSLATAMDREIKTKGEKARFRKVGPGLFAAA